MSYEENRPLPVMDILKNAYTDVFQNTTSVLIYSYLLAGCAFLTRLILPQPSATTGMENYILASIYIFTGVLFVLFINILFYRLFVLGKSTVLKISVNQLLISVAKMFGYTLILLFLLFIAMVTLLLFIGMIASIINQVSGQVILGQAVLDPLVRISALLVVLLIFMRMQPTFIRVAVGGPALPMRSSYYYTRDNTKALISIGFFSFIPATAPLLIFYLIPDISNINPLLIDIVGFVAFPLLLLPHIILRSAGVGMYNYLVPHQNEQSVDIRV